MEKNTYNKKANVVLILLSFVITLTVAALAYAKLHIYPGGKYTLLTYDLANQYLPFICSLRYVGTGDCSLFFSMFGGLGTNYIANIAYYMANPINWRTVLVPREQIPDSM